MRDVFSSFEPTQEKERIVSFLRKTFEKQKIQNTVIGLSGGIDSSVSFFLLKEVLSPEHIFVSHLYYDVDSFEHIEKSVQAAKIPQENIYLFSIKELVDATCKTLGVTDAKSDRMRKGNIAARMRMVILFDLAKKHTALVCGTENRSEHLLGYFTRFGDQASDIEPIEHLYKTQIFALAKHLGVPKFIIDQSPTAGLWSGQTDENEMGFSYAEADTVLSLYIDHKLPLDKILVQDYPHAKKIIQRYKQNRFKHEVPYTF